MKYRISEYFSKENSQSFKTEEFEWKKKVGIESVYVSGKINIVEKLNSNKKFALDKILDKFLGVDSSIPLHIYDGEVDCTNYSKDVLDVALNMSELAENYRKKFNLGNELSMTDIFKFIENESIKYKKQIDDVINKFNDVKKDDVNGKEKNENVEKKENIKKDE